MPTLIITEKPKSALRIAHALSDGKFEKKTGKKISFYEFNSNGDKFYVVPAVGHLFTLTQKDKEWNYPVFDLKWIEIFKKNKKAGYAKKYYDTIKKIADKCDDFIVATDYDIEGEVIAYNILRFICKRENAKRMKFSTLTFSELKNSYRNIMQSMDKGLIDAGLLRHILDWYWGINTSRALMHSVKRNERFAILSIGRVQGPTLKILVDREMEIRNFKPKKYWQIILTSDGIKAIYKERRIWEKDKAIEICNQCRNKNALVDKIERRKYKILQPTPFNLTDLQKESYRIFKLNPSQTLNIAQNLYQSGLISYPRTSSQKLPESIGFKNIIESLSKIGYKKEINLLDLNNLKPREGKKTDPAHPAIYPTGQKPDNLSSNERKIYDLIVRRFLSTFSDECIREKMEVILKIDNHLFLSEGSRTIKKGWIEIYNPYVKFKEDEFPELNLNQTLKVEKIELLEKETEPPKRYTPASLIAELDRRNLGTKSTRSQIIDSLYNRKYIKNVPIEVTDLGIKIIDIMERYSPEIISEDLTRKFEEEMDLVMRREKEKYEVIKEAREKLTAILSNFKYREEEIGREILKSIIESRKKDLVLGKCRECDGDLRIITSKKSGKRFVGCSNYNNGCKVSFPLPQDGKIKILNEKCKLCSYPVISIIRKGKRPWKMCINNKCESKNQ